MATQIGQELCSRCGHERNSHVPDCRFETSTPHLFVRSVRSSTDEISRNTFSKINDIHSTSSRTSSRGLGVLLALGKNR